MYRLDFGGREHTAPAPLMGIERRPGRFLRFQSGLLLVCGRVQCALAPGHRPSSPAALLVAGQLPRQSDGSTGVVGVAVGADFVGELLRHRRAADHDLCR